MKLYQFLPQLKIDQQHIDEFLSDRSGWSEITPEHENHGYVQYYKQYQPQWLTSQLLPIWSYMGVLVACRAGEYLLPHVDRGRSAAILIPCTPSYQDTSLDFWHMPQWSGTIGQQEKFHDYSSGHIIDSVIYTDPILFKNVPHGVDNTKSKFDRINLSVCFMEPFTYEVLEELNKRGLLITA
jgi:hypothetical protein